MEYLATISGVNDRLQSTGPPGAYGCRSAALGLRRLGGTDLYMQPMALALGYGILFATPLTLVLIPSLYMIGADIGGLYRRKKA